MYIDHIILVGNSLAEFNVIKGVLDNKFRIKDLELLRYFLGLEVAHSASGITVCQSKYCLELLADSGLIASKLAATPLDYATFSYVPAYRRLVGRLLYLTTTRPNITFATQQLSQFMTRPTMQHYKGAMKVVRYLKGSPDSGLFFLQQSSIQLFGFSDADWGVY